LSVRKIVLADRVGELVHKTFDIDGTTIRWDMSCNAQIRAPRRVGVLLADC
jgi:hypothetical protein